MHVSIDHWYQKINVTSRKGEDQAKAKAVPRVVVISPIDLELTPMTTSTSLQTTTTATTLSAGRVGGRRGNVLDTADLHASTGKGTESGLSTGTGGLGAVTWRWMLGWKKWMAEIIEEHTTGGTDLDVQSGDAELLAASSDVLGRQHGSVGGGLVTIGLDLHATSHTADGFAATGNHPG